MIPTDKNGNPLRQGDRVKLVRVDPRLLTGLPEEDQLAIKNSPSFIFLGKDWILGKLELEFTDESRDGHWIFVDSSDVEVLSPSLSERKLEYLGILQEECAEVSVIVSKIRRFGLFSCHPDRPLETNHALLIQELGDVYAMIQLLEESSLLTREQLEAAARIKRDKLQKFLMTTE